MKFQSVREAIKGKLVSANPNMSASAVDALLSPAATKHIFWCDETPVTETGAPIEGVGDAVRDDIADFGWGFLPRVTVAIDEAKPKVIGAYTAVLCHKSGLCVALVSDAASTLFQHVHARNGTVTRSFPKGYPDAGDNALTIDDLRRYNAGFTRIARLCGATHYGQNLATFVEGDTNDYLASGEVRVILRDIQGCLANEHKVLAKADTTMRFLADLCNYDDEVSQENHYDSNFHMAVLQAPMVLTPRVQFLDFVVDTQDFSVKTLATLMRSPYALHCPEAFTKGSDVDVSREPDGTLIAALRRGDSRTKCIGAFPIMASWVSGDKNTLRIANPDYAFYTNGRANVDSRLVGGPSVDEPLVTALRDNTQNWIKGISIFLPEDMKENVIGGGPVVKPHLPSGAYPNLRVTVEERDDGTVEWLVTPTKRVFKKGRVESWKEYFDRVASNTEVQRVLLHGLGRGAMISFVGCQNRVTDEELKRKTSLYQVLNALWTGLELMTVKEDVQPILRTSDKTTVTVTGLSGDDTEEIPL